MTNAKVACIGSRTLTGNSKYILESAGMYYAERGYEVHTGNAVGSDQAYARGANHVDPTRVHLYLPWRSYESAAIVPGNKVYLADDADEETQSLAERNHHAWQWLSQAVRKLMIRNAMIICGSSLVLAVPSYNKPGYGGTGHGMRIALELGIPVWLPLECTWWNGH